MAKTKIADYNIDEDVIAISETLEENLTVDGTVISVDEKAFEASLPEGTNLKDIKDAQRLCSKFVAAAKLATGKKALEIMEEDSEVESVTMAQTSLGYDSLALTYARKAVNRNVQTGEDVVSYGSCRVTYQTRAKKKVGQSLKVSNFLKPLAEEMLG